MCPQCPRRSRSALLAGVTVRRNPRLYLGNLIEPGVTRNWICKRHSFVCQHLQWEGKPWMRLPGRSSAHICREAGVVQVPGGSWPGAPCPSGLAETSRCLPARSCSESAARLSVLTLEGKLCCWLHLDARSVSVFLLSGLPAALSAGGSVAVTREVPSICAPWCGDVAPGACWCSLLSLLLWHRTPALNTISTDCTRGQGSSP